MELRTWHNRNSGYAMLFCKIYMKFTKIMQNDRKRKNLYFKGRTYCKLPISYDIISINVLTTVEKEDIIMEKVRPNVLIVDDDIQALETMSLYLTDVADVFTVNAGRQAIEYVQLHHVDVILLDVDMPIMDGFKTLEQLRNLKECINIPVIFVTGKKDKYTVMNSVFMGVDGYLVKPVDKESLQNKVMEVYNKKGKNKNKKTILAIDDDMTYLKLIDSYLRDEYKVIMINSAKLALDYLREHTPDVILLDYQMPLYNGANVMNMIQRNQDGPQVPIIILSGVLDKEILLKCYPCKPAACLVKPVSKEVLIENIEKAMHP